MQKIVYSTCSIHVVENEHVVFAALRSKEAIERGFTLAPKAEVIPTWSRRGLEGAASNDDERERDQSSASSGIPLIVVHPAACHLQVACLIHLSGVDPRTEPTGSSSRV